MFLRSYGPQKSPWLAEEPSGLRHRGSGAAAGAAVARAPASTALPSPRAAAEATRKRLVAAVAAAPASSDSQIIEEDESFIWHRVDMHNDTMAGLALRYRTTKTNIKRYNGAPCSLWRFSLASRAASLYRTGSATARTHRNRVAHLTHARSLPSADLSVSPPRRRQTFRANRSKRVQCFASRSAARSAA